MIPHKIAMGHILTGRHMTAQEAHRWGIVNEVVPLAALMPTVFTWANDILAAPRSRSVPVSRRRCRAWAIRWTSPCT